MYINNATWLTKSFVVGKFCGSVVTANSLISFIYTMNNGSA